MNHVLLKLNAILIQKMELYRAHTLIDDFIKDIKPNFKTLNSEKKRIYIMGDFKITFIVKNIIGSSV